MVVEVITHYQAKEKQMAKIKNIYTYTGSRLLCVGLHKIP